jgi:hypothetical protein
MDQDIQVRTYSPAYSVGQARRRAAVMLLVATGIAMVIGGSIFAFVLYADFLTDAFTAVNSWFTSHGALAIIAATSPLAAAMLVGYGYMQRAIRRRATENSESQAEANGASGEVKATP